MLLTLNWVEPVICIKFLLFRTCIGADSLIVLLVSSEVILSMTNNEEVHKHVTSVSLTLGAHAL